MAKVAFAVTETTVRSAGFDNLTANTKVFTRVYKGTQGGLKFQTTEAQPKSYPASTVGVYQLEAHKTAGGKILFPPKSILELRGDLVKDKILTQKDAELVVPGRFGTFFVNDKPAKK